MSSKLVYIGLYLCLFSLHSMADKQSEFIDARVQMLKIIATNKAVLKNKIIGTTEMGFPIDAVTFTPLGSANEYKPHYLVIATHHGNEPMSYLVAMKSISLLTKRKFLNKFKGQVTVIPCLNPEGLISESRLNNRGIDLNRDYPPPNQKIDSPLSKEIHMLIKFLKSRDFDMILSLHTGDEAIYYPWGFKKDKAKDHIYFESTAQNIAKHLSIKKSMASNLDYLSEGELIDFAYSELKIPAFTIEFSQKHHLKLAQKLKKIEAISSSLIEYLFQNKHFLKVDSTS